MPKNNLKAIMQAVRGVVAAYYRWFVIAELVLLAWLGWALLLHGQYTHIRESGILEYQTRVQQRSDRRDSLKQLEQLSEEVASLDHERLQQIETVLPTGIDPVAMIDQMQAFASAAGVSILSMDVVQSSSASTTSAAQTSTAGVLSVSRFSSNDIHTAVISINLETPDASYDGLKQFLNVLESFVPVLNLRNLTYAPETTSFALQLETYYIDSETTPR